MGVRTLGRCIPQRLSHLLTSVLGLLCTVERGSTWLNVLLFAQGAIITRKRQDSGCYVSPVLDTGVPLNLASTRD
jgi:hypothetical protein